MALETDNGEHQKLEHKNSLARLRFFIGPHSPDKSRRFHSLGRSASGDDASDNNAIPPPPPPDSPGGSLTRGSATTVSVPGGMAGVCQLGHTTKDFSRVKHLLQCCLRGYKLHDDVNVWDLRNPAILSQFEQHAGGLLQLDSWVEAGDIGPNKAPAMADIRSYGFTAVESHETGMMFTTGDIALTSEDDQSSENKELLTKQLVLCKIAVGRSLVVADEAETKKRLPSGYDSFYIERGTNQDQQGSPGAKERYYHEYILTNPHQILPQFLVRFQATKVGEEANVDSSNLCALCEKNKATVSCHSCEAGLCQGCDVEVHSTNKLVQRHKRTSLDVDDTTDGEKLHGQSIAGRRRRSSVAALSVNVDSKNQGDLASNGDESEAGESLVDAELSPAVPRVEELTEGEASQIVDAQLKRGLGPSLASARCRTHTSKSVEFYCPLCAVPVCVHCKMIGDHAVGEKGSHRLVTIADAYEHSLIESLRSDPLVDSRRTMLVQRLLRLGARRKEVEANRESVAAAIRQQCAQALQRLDAEAATKTRLLHGETLELHRQAQQLHWFERRLDEQRAVCGAVEFLAAWNQHKLLRADQRDTPVVRRGAAASTLDQVRADLQLMGKLQVMTGDQLLDEGFDSSSGEEDVEEVDEDGEIVRRGTRRSDSVGSSDMLVTAMSPKGKKVVEEMRQDFLQSSSLARPSSFSSKQSDENMDPAEEDGDEGVKRRSSLLPPGSSSKSPSDRMNWLPGSNAKSRTMAGHQDNKTPGGANWSSLMRQERSMKTNGSGN